MELQVGVKAVLTNKEGKVLLLKRSAEKYGKTQGSLDIVGGRIDAGSSLMDNLRREIREETGLELVDAPRLIAAQDILLPERERHVVRLTYVGRIDGEPQLDTSENVEFGWYDFAQLVTEPELDRYVRELIENGLLTAATLG